VKHGAPMKLIIKVYLGHLKPSSALLHEQMEEKVGVAEV